jgi:very-short-patch-repair endonuclease
MPAMRTTRLDAFARTHHGLIRCDVAERLGISRAGWYRAHESGLLVEVHPQVSRLPGAPITWHQRVLAAVWGTGPGAMASHRPSARLWGAERSEDELIDVISSSRTRSMYLEGVVVHRPRDRVEVRAVTRGAIPTTPPLRMLVDLGAVDRGGVYPAMQALIVQRIVRPEAVAATIERHSMQGRHGIGALREALARYPLAAEVADSVLETLMASVALRYALPAMEFHPIVEGMEIDFRVLGTNILVECDGRAHHGLGTDGFERDRRRDQQTLGAGYVTVRVTWQQLTRAPAEFVRRMREVIARWAPHLLAA